MKRYFCFLGRVVFPTPGAYVSRHLEMGYFLFFVVLIISAAQRGGAFKGAAGEWEGADETGRNFAIGDPPPRAPRLPPNAT